MWIRATRNPPASKRDPARSRLRVSPIFTQWLPLRETGGYQRHQKDYAEPVSLRIDQCAAVIDCRSFLHDGFLLEVALSQSID